MTDQPNAIAFDVDPDSLKSLRKAFPGWKIEEVSGSTPASLALDWNPEAANLLIVGSQGAAETLGLCQGLRSQEGRALTPLLVLVPPAHHALVRAALEAGADSCLVLPVRTADLVSMLARAREGNQPGRHTLDLNRAQSEDQWRDEGGEG